MRIILVKLAVVLLFICFTYLSSYSQNNKEQILNDTLTTAISYIQNYYQVSPTLVDRDSSIMESFHFAINYITDTSFQRKTNEIINFVENNNPELSIIKLQNFTDSLKFKKEEYSLFRENHSAIDSLIEIHDSIGINSSDTNFIDFLNMVMENEQGDSIYLDKKMSNALLNENFYPDSLIHSFHILSNYLKNDTNLSWLSSIRNDTTYFYITDLEGDSIKIKLYENSPEIIRFDITDFWGTTIPALIRDVQPNSIRILIDDTPEIDYDANEKAKQAMENFGIIQHYGYDFKLEKRELPKILKPWQFYGNSELAGSQVGLYQWTKGGESSITLLSNIELYLQYKNGKHSWNSYSKFKIGLIRQGDYDDASVDYKTNEDKIDIESKYGYKVFGKTSLTVMSNFKSQFAPSYEYPTDSTRNIVSEFMSPANITFALGLDYKPSKKLTVFLSPITIKSTIVLNDSIDETKYGLTEGEDIRHELGAIFKAYHKMNIWGDIEMENTLELFSNYLYYPQNIDIDWDFNLILPVNDYIRATISTTLIYNDDEKVTKKNSDGTTYQSKGIQFKEMLTLGLRIKF